MHKYKTVLLKKEAVATSTKAFYLKKPAGFKYKAGQFIIITLPGLKPKDNRYPMSLASAPDEDELMIAMRMTGSPFKNKLDSLNIGDELEIEGPRGQDMVLNPEAVNPLVFIAGGIGITPFRSLIMTEKTKGFPRPITLFYSNRTPATASFVKELQDIKYQDFKLVCTMTNLDKNNPDWKGECELINQEMIKKYIKNIQQPTYYIVGLPAMVKAIKQLLLNMKIPSQQIKLEIFDYGNI